MVQLRKRITEVVDSDFRGKQFDLLIAAIGYEQRASFVLKKHYRQFERILAFAFQDRHVLNFDANLQYFEKRGARIEYYGPDDFITACYKHIHEEFVRFSGTNVSICVDISSMSRPMIAAIVHVLCSQLNGSVSTTFVYSEAKYTPPSRRMPPVVMNGPVLREYAGWTVRPEAPTMAIMGLGYERGRALGAFETLELEPHSCWLFLAQGRDQRYRKSVLSQNEELLAIVPRERQIDYFLDAPKDTISKLTSRVDGMVREGRVVLVPFGPKIFNLCCLLVSQARQPDITVWRMSGAAEEEAVDRIPNGQIISFSVELD